MEPGNEFPGDPGASPVLPTGRNERVWPAGGLSEGRPTEAVKSSPHGARETASRESRSLFRQGLETTPGPALVPADERERISSPLGDLEGPAGSGRGGRARMDLLDRVPGESRSREEARERACGQAVTGAHGRATMSSIHNLCVTLLNDLPAAPFHVKRDRWKAVHPPVYPQGVQAFYVVFHVKQASLWITSVDNFQRAAMPTGGDVRGRRGVGLNG